MKSKKMICMSALLALLLAPSCAMAKTNFNVSINLFDCLSLLAPRPVVVAPPPVMVVPPAFPIYHFHPAPYYFHRPMVRGYYYRDHCHAMDPYAPGEYQECP